MLKISSKNLILIYSFISVLIFNWAFFHNLYIAEAGIGGSLVAIILLICLSNILYAILFVRYIAKPLLILLIIGNTVALYFMNTYNAAIDKIMIINALQTDKGEVGELLSWNMLPYALFALLAVVFVLKLRINFAPLKQELKQRSIIILISTILGGLIFTPFYKKIDVFMSENKELRYYILPSNYISSTFSVIKMMHKHPDKLKILTENVTVKPYWPDNGRKNLFIFILGETARAANFSLHGYQRPTNKPLSPYQKDMIVFDKMQSCGTSTAISVPCIFSPYPRKEFKNKLTSYSENVLDVFKEIGYEVIWKDANSGCKGVCNRVKTEIYCEYGTCMDIEMNQNFAEQVKKANKDMFVVFHQRGSHGPMYSNRYPLEFELYKPACKDEDIKNCPKETVINAYDNSIYYTSYVIADLLKEIKTLEDEYNIVVFYTSDHGETLGEDGKYLHGMIYESAPKYQKEVPFFVWMPKSASKGLSLNRECLNKKIHQPVSHDNIFHSLLGLGGIKIPEYDESLDIFAHCHP